MELIYSENGNLNKYFNNVHIYKLQKLQTEVTTNFEHRLTVFIIYIAYSHKAAPLSSPLNRVFSS